MEQFTDIRLKFNVNIPEGALMKGIFGYRELFLRAQKSGKLAPYTCGLSAFAKDVEFHFFTVSLYLYQYHTGGPSGTLGAPTPARRTPTQPIFLPAFRL